MERISERCTVTANRQGTPLAVTRAGTKYCVFDVKDYWREQSKWWTGKQRKKRSYFLLKTDRGDLLVYFEHASDTWTLARKNDPMPGEPRPAPGTCRATSGKSPSR